MHRPRRIPVWIAALALLLHLVAMSLMGAGGQPRMAGHCPIAEASRHASHFATYDSHSTHHSESAPKPAPLHHLGMPCCCAGSASLVAIPVSAPIFLAPRLVQLENLSPAMASPLSPRYRWPSLNPRASPLA